MRCATAARAHTHTCHADRLHSPEGARRLKDLKRCTELSAESSIKEGRNIHLMTNSHKSQSETPETHQGRKTAAKTPPNKKVPCPHYIRDASTWAAGAGARALAPHRARARDRASSEEAYGAAQFFSVSRVAEARRLHSCAAIRSRANVAPRRWQKGLSRPKTKMARRRTQTGNCRCRHCQHAQSWFLFHLLLHRLLKLDDCVAFELALLDLSSLSRKSESTLVGG